MTIKKAGNGRPPDEIRGEIIGRLAYAIESVAEVQKEHSKKLDHLNNQVLLCATREQLESVDSRIGKRIDAVDKRLNDFEQFRAVVNSKASRNNVIFANILAAGAIVVAVIAIIVKYL
jgi:Flp pilus assembly protein TadB